MIVKENISIENARIAFRNFAGKEGKFNPAGKRNFCVMFEPDMARDLERDGWNIKYLKPRDEDDDPQAYMQVAVNYDNIQPKIILVTKKNKQPLTEETVEMLDWAEIKNVDLVIRPYNWEVNGKTGVKAYVKTMYVTIEEDAFADKYSDDVSEDDALPF